MNITDELRDCIRTANRGYEDVRNPYNDREVLHIPEEELLKIAGRIDREHESACAEAYGNGVMSVPIALDESAWVKLPVDADGVPIRIGDVMTYMDNTKPMEVVALVPPAVFLTEDGPRYANMCRHHHAPTVEDVLRDLLEEHGDPTCDATPSELAEKYAAKLRLAGDGE